MTFTKKQIEEFNNRGFIIERALAGKAQCESMIALVNNSLNPPLAPLEFETDVHYPGSPPDRLAPGGDTPRRLLNAFTRDQVFRDWATSKEVVERVGELLGSNHIQLSQNHHNCIMTKHPGFSSSTLWHKDIRYWLFDQPELVSVWLALGNEFETNGGMQLIPASHLLDLDRGYYDAANFLRTDLAENKVLIDSAVSADMEQGDVLFFHCRTLHAAGRNETDRVKMSVVFTYHDRQNQPIAGSRSSAVPDIPCEIGANG